MYRTAGRQHWITVEYGKCDPSEPRRDEVGLGAVRPHEVPSSLDEHSDGYQIHPLWENCGFDILVVQLLYPKPHMFVHIYDAVRGIQRDWTPRLVQCVVADVLLSHQMD